MAEAPSYAVAQVTEKLAAAAIEPSTDGTAEQTANAPAVDADGEQKPSKSGEKKNAKAAKKAERLAARQQQQQQAAAGMLWPE